MWGADAVVPSGGLKASFGLKNADWAFVTCGAAHGGARRLRQRPEGRSRPRWAAGSQGRSRCSGSVRSGRASWSAGAAGRTRPAQSQHSRDTVELPQRRLHGFLSGRRGSCQRLLWAGAQSRHVPRRTAGVMRRRGQRSQCTAGRGMRHGAAIKKACSTARADICTPHEDCHAAG